MAGKIRKSESPWAQAFWANYILLLHAIAAVAICLFVLRVIDGKTVNLNSEESLLRRKKLQADDITTAVSAAMVAIRILTGAWTAQSAWRCALILLETQGITLRQFNRIISWPAYFVRGSTDAYIATLILLLLVPANLVAPVITGSVGWKGVAWEVSNVPFQHAGPARTNLRWNSHTKRFGSTLDDFFLLAISRAGVGWIELSEDSSRSSRLVTTSQQRMSVDSVIDNLTLPFIEIHSISWDKKSDHKKTITDEFRYKGNANSKLSLSGERPFNSWFPGNAVLFDEHLQDNHPRPETNDTSLYATLPPPTVFRGTKKIAILLGKVSWGENVCSYLRDTIFGNEIVDRLDPSLYGISFDENCFFIGTVHFTAGVIRKRASYITPRVVEAVADSPATIEGDNWVIEGLYLLPDVMTKVALANASQIPTWDNLDGYIKDLVRISYQAVWGQLAYWYNDMPLNLTAHESARGLQAVVSLRRVIGWYIAQFLVLVSAALLWILQRRSHRPIAIDAGAVALLVDAGPILNEYDATQELSRMSYVTGRECGMVRLTERNVPDSGEQVRLGRYGFNSGEGAGEPRTSAGKPPARFMLVPWAGDR